MRREELTGLVDEHLVEGGFECASGRQLKPLLNHGELVGEGEAPRSLVDLE